MCRILVLKTGSALPATLRARGDFPDLFSAGLGLSPSAVQVVDVTARAHPPENGFDAVIVTGSAANVTESPAFLDAAAHWLRQIVNADMPVLAVCFGHQLLAHALGGRVARHPAGRRIGLVTTGRTAAGLQDPLLGAAVFDPAAGEPRFFVSHQEVVAEPPPGVVALGGWSGDPHQAWRYRNAWSVQFHPEFDGTVLGHYLDHFESELHAGGADILALRRMTGEVHSGDTLLMRFAQWVNGNGPSREPAHENQPKAR